MANAEAPKKSNGSVGRTSRQTLVVVGIVVLVIIAWQILDALLLGFMAIILATLFHGCAARLSRVLPISRRWSLAVVALGTIGIIWGAVVLLGPSVSNQVAELRETLPASVQKLRTALEGTQWGQALLDEAGGGSQVTERLFSRLSGAASTAITVLTDIVLVIFVALFFAVDPDLYKRGFVMLVPAHRADRVRETLDAAGRALWTWIIAKLIVMFVVAVLTTVGLMIVGIPLALVLGIIAGIFDFVPFIGPIAAAVPGVLLAFTIGPTEALYAAAIYLVIQQLESYVLTPIVQQEEVSLPPVLVLLSVVAGGLLFGIAGIIMATPLLVVIMVIVDMLYIEDVLGKEVDIPGQ